MLQIASRSRNGNGINDLLDYLKSLEPENITELTSCAGDDVLEAMNSFIQRLLGEPHICCSMTWRCMCASDWCMCMLAPCCICGRMALHWDLGGFSGRFALH